MNIKITHDWLLEFLKTKASPEELQKYLSLSGPSIERVEKSGGDFIFDIEIISNRIDTASVVGVASEAVAILPVYGLAAKFKFNPLTELKFKKIQPKFNDRLKLEVAVDNDLCSRFTALIFDGVKITPSPQFMQKRLAAAGIKVINNVVDISNYLMLTLGQPVHMFDYDKVSGHKMVLRASRQGEKITILDGQVVELPIGSIVIEDGAGELTDLCGIMGGAKSAINKDAKRIIFFVQTYNKERIRKTVMETGVRTAAATYFEKGLDEERVEPTVVYGVDLIEKYTEGRVASKLIDVYPAPYLGKTVNTKYSFFEKIIGVKIDKEVINKILADLGFKVNDRGEDLEVTVPSHRKNDISIPEDLVEEVARIWGYHQIPINLPPPATVFQPVEFEKMFKTTAKVKLFLKHLGLSEVINYSMISQDQIKVWGVEENNHLRLANSISKEIEYMRRSLLPSLYKNIVDNIGKKEVLKFFELAKVYHPRKESLPEERYKLALAVNTDYFDLKGAVEALIDELNIKEIEWKRGITDQGYCRFFDKNICATSLIAGKEAIYLGQSKLNEGIFFAEIDFETIVENSRLLKPYTPVNPYAVIKLDLTITLTEKTSFIELKKRILSASDLIQKLELIDQYQDRITLRFHFNHPTRNLTEAEAKKELEKVQSELQR